MSFKGELLEFILADLRLKLEALQADLEDMRLELSDNTKSTAGDKHETSRAMVQLEMEKVGKRHFELQKTYDLALRVLDFPTSLQVQLGSLVASDGPLFLLGLPLGNITFEGRTIFCVSLQSPVGQLLLGKMEGDTVTLPGGVYTLKSVQ